MKICPLGAEPFHADGRTDRHDGADWRRRLKNGTQKKVSIECENIAKKRRNVETVCCVKCGKASLYYTTTERMRQMRHAPRTMAAM